MTTGRRGFIGALAALSPAMEKLLADVPEVESVSKITPTTGSVFVMTCAQHMTQEAVERIGAGWKEYFAYTGIPAPRLVVLDGGVTLQQLVVNGEPFQPVFSEEEIGTVAVNAVKRHLDNWHGGLAQSIAQTVRR